VALSATMFILMVVMNTYGPISGIICLVCLVFLFFEAAFGICLGCQFYSLVYREQPTLCPGEVCETKARVEAQKTTLAQLLVLLAAAGLVVAGTASFKGRLSAQPKPLFAPEQGR